MGCCRRWVLIKFLTACLVSFSGVSHAAPYWSNSLSTTTGRTTLIMTGSFEIRKSTPTNVTIFKVNHTNGFIEGYGGMAISTGPIASALLFVSSSSLRVGVGTITPRDMLDVNGGLIVTS